jgi:beta-galactosidase
MRKGITAVILTTGIIVTAFTVTPAETYTPEPSNRVKINLGETPWKFIKSDPQNAQAAAYNDAAAPEVGIPHTWNDTDSFINEKSGGGDGSMFGGACWYRKHLTIDSKYTGRKVFIEFEGAHVGIQVYVNGTLIKGNSAINPNATHVVGFMGFVVDVTDKITFGADNLIACRVTKNGGFYNDPGFSTAFRFGQGTGGIFRPVWLHITDKLHVPLNLYSCVNQWGTYAAAQTVADDGSSATVKLLTNVQNENAAAQSVTLTTKIVDVNNTLVWSGEATNSVPANGTFVFDQTATIANPKLWYPNNSIYGKPNMHKVYHIVKVNGTTIDVFQSALGIRVITWDKDFPYINGKKHFLWGASSRYDYPALGTALPPEVEFRDAKILADIGGNLWRPGHSTCSPGFVAACDQYGIMIIQPSGEGEGAFSATTVTDAKGILKSEIHRDMIIRDRNNPSILAWESSNGDMAPDFAAALKAISVQWDPVHTRAQADRSETIKPIYNANGDIRGCTVTGCEMYVKNDLPNLPAWGSEYWGRASTRFAYDFEIKHAAEFLHNWKNGRSKNCFGIAQWYFAETPGENPVSQSLVDPSVSGELYRSFGCSLTDFNRIPKMLYYIYGAAWTPFSIKPRVSIAHHWNRSGTVRVNVFSNCPSVKLQLNGTTIGQKTPNPWNTTTNNNDQTATDLPCQCYWDVAWQAGTLRAEGLDASGNVVCFDEKKTAGAPDHLVLTVDPHIAKPDGETFKFRPNGTDAALILATVVDANGVWCPTATGLINWTVSGPGNYRGGCDQFVDATKPKSWHAPGDHELSIEGGMCKVAVRSTFTPGIVTVAASSSGLKNGSTTFTVCNDCTEAIKPAGFSPAAIGLQSKLDLSRSTVRFYINKTAKVSVEMVNAQGRVAQRVDAGMQSEGWHPVKLSRYNTSASGVYFVKLVVNGVPVATKRTIAIH